MRYYYGQLSRPLQSVYDALLGGFCALAPGVRIPMLDEKQLADVYLRLKLGAAALLRHRLPLPVDGRRGAYGTSAGVFI